MLPIHRIPGWTNLRRRRFLDGFRGDLAAYFEDVRHEAFPYRLVEGERAAELRADLESRLDRCRKVVHAAGVGSLIRQAPGERTGEVVRVNLVVVVFDLARYNLTVPEVFRILDLAGARYREGATRAWLRTVNPFYWLDMLLGVAEILALSPVRLVGRSPREVARTPLGVKVRRVVRLAVLLLVGWGAFVALGVDSAVLGWARGLVAG